jgi:hypothetical protein
VNRALLTLETSAELLKERRAQIKKLEGTSNSITSGSFRDGGPEKNPVAQKFL